MLVQRVWRLGIMTGNLFTPYAQFAAIEFARIADMFGVNGMEVRMAEHIKALILAYSTLYSYNFDSNKYLISSELISSAVRLPDGHPRQGILAAAVIDGETVQPDGAPLLPGLTPSIIRRKEVVLRRRGK